MRLLLVVVAAGLVLAQEAGSGGGDDEEDDAVLKARLLASYGPSSTRPGLAARRLGLLSTQACTASQIPADAVEAQVYVDKWHPLETSKQTFGLDGYLRSWWWDPRLRYNGTSTGGCRDKLVFGAVERGKIWKVRCRQREG
jgi:hypothetical protein